VAEGGGSRKKRAERIDWDALLELALGVLRLPADEFWDLTPYEFERLVAGWEKAAEMRRQEMAWQTCHIINCCGHVRRPLRIKDLTGEEAGPEAATEEDKEHFARMRNTYG